MATVQDIYSWVDGFAPFETAMSFDNPGLLVGDENQVVTRAVVSLDITPAVVEEAAALGAQLIVSHHPVIFRPLKRLNSASVPYRLAQNGISAVCAHTNLDMAAGGVNTCLAERLGLHHAEMLKEYENSGLPEGLVGELDASYSPEEFARYVKENLGCDGLRYVPGKDPVKRVALCGGGGADLLYDAVACGAQAFVTGESKHNILLDAEAMGITLVDAGHFYTEDVVILPLMERLQKAFPDILFQKSQVMHSPAKYL